MSESRDHVVREPLPWRDEQLTECGRELSDVASAISVAQLRKRLKECGQQRTAFTVCMTCYHHLHNGWDVDPVSVIQQEGYRSGKSMRSYASAAPINRPEQDRRLIFELHAIAKLVAAHRGEFDQLVEEERAGAEWKDRLEQKNRRKRSSTS